MMYPVVRELAADGVPVATGCRVLKVSTSGFYDWDSRGPSVRDWDQALLIDAIRAAHVASYGTYGHRRSTPSSSLRRPARRAPQAVARLHPPEPGRDILR